jgi:hypothetical protein
MKDTRQVKFSAYVPEDLYLQFTAKAREVSVKRNGRTKGAITIAIIEAMEQWLKVEA